jgi:hypothetical protein
MSISGIGILKVHYNDNEKKDYITHLLAGSFTSENDEKIGDVGKFLPWAKGQIVDMVTDTPVKTNVFTIIKDGMEYILGAEVEACFESNNVYLRTKGNSKKEDNLGDLDVF